MWTSKALVVLALVAVVTAQIPSLGWCPDYQPMANFNMNRFLGQWHEAERYFTVTELGSRCVTTNYEKMPDGRVWVSNEIKNSFTGVKRVVDGQLQVVGRDGEGKLSVKYTSLPVPYDTQYTILDTDYDNFAVMWSCSGIGPVHTQNAWVMTRERLAPGLVLQRAYGVLDKFKISRAFFVKTNQEDCTIQPLPIESVDPTPPTETKSASVIETEEKKEAVKESSVKTVPELIQSTAEAKKPEEEKKEEPPKEAASEPEKPKEEKPAADEPAKDVPKKAESDDKKEEIKEEKKDEKKDEKKEKVIEIEKKKVKISIPLPDIPKIH